MRIKAFQLLGAMPTPMASRRSRPTPSTARKTQGTWHAFTTGPLVMNKAKFDAFPVDLREVFVKTAVEIAGTQRQMNEDTEGSSLAALKSAGMQAVETPHRESFAKIAAVWGKMASPGSG